MLIRCDGIFVLFGVDELFFLRPALIDALQAPFEALFFADGLVVHEDEDGIGVGAGADAEGEPAALFDRHVEGEIAHLTVGGDGLLLNGDTVDEEFDRHLA